MKVTILKEGESIMRAMGDLTEMRGFTVDNRGVEISEWCVTRISVDPVMKPYTDPNTFETNYKFCHEYACSHKRLNSPNTHKDHNDWKLYFRDIPVDFIEDVVEEQKKVSGIFMHANEKSHPGRVYGFDMKKAEKNAYNEDYVNEQAYKRAMQIIKE